MWHKILNCSTRRLTCFLILISFSVFIHVWYVVFYMLDISHVTNFLTIARRRFHKDVKIPVNRDTKYILFWHGRDYYDNYDISRNCPSMNCIFREDANIFNGNYTYFDAIIFKEKVLTSEDRPKKRSQKQLYIFETLESAYNHPACEVNNDNFFNWTLTYRLDSTIAYSYFVVQNRSEAIVAPSRTVEWEQCNDTISAPVKSILMQKKKAAAWIVSNCRTDNQRDQYLSSLQEQMDEFSLHIDVFGECSKRKCPNDDCEPMIKQNYYFYMAFENSFSQDYVTEKILHAYLNYAIPVVYGGANYSWFLPPGSYLNANQMHPYNLAHAIKQAIDDPKVHESYFTWTNLYTIGNYPNDKHPLCNLCKALNDERAKHVPAIENFRVWWNGLKGMKWCLPQEYWNETMKLNMDTKHIFNPFPY